MDCSTAAELAAAAQHIVICVTPSNTLWWTYIPGFATPVIGLGALYFASQNIRNARDLARNKATLDLIEKRESTDHYRKINERFSDLRKGKGFAHLNDPATAADIDDRHAVIDYLNHYEMVAIGIRRDLLDATLYRAWMEGPFVRDWNAASGWVQRERWKADSEGTWTYRASILQNFQKIAQNWSSDAIVLNETTGPPPLIAAGPGDQSLPEPIDDVALGE